MWVDSGRRNELIGEEIRRLLQSESSGQSGQTPQRARSDGDDSFLGFGDAYIGASRLDFT